MISYSLLCLHFETRTLNGLRLRINLSQLLSRIEVHLLVSWLQDNVKGTYFEIGLPFCLLPLGFQNATAADMHSSVIWYKFILILIFDPNLYITQVISSCFGKNLRSLNMFFQHGCCIFLVFLQIK